MKLLGTCQFPMAPVHWLQYTTSWFRAFREIALSDIYEVHIVVSSDIDEETFQDNIHFHFIDRKHPDSHYINFIKDIKPDVIMMNGYAECMDRAIAINLNCKKVLRLHSEPWLCFPNGRTEVLNNVDLVICPMDIHMEELRNKWNYQGDVYPLMFGADLEVFKNQKKERTIDFISATPTDRPLKGGIIVKEVFEILNSKGYKALNIGGLSKEDLADYFNKAKIFYFPSFSEASGSRVMVEAIACGLIPVTDTLGKTTSIVANMFDGYNIDSGARIANFKLLTYTKEPEVLANELIQILKSAKLRNSQLINKFSMSKEVSELVSLFKSLTF